VGAGNIAHGDMLRVPLTTVSWSRQNMGERAAQLILDQLEAHPSGPFERVIVPPSLVVRGSTARLESRNGKEQGGRGKEAGGRRKEEAGRRKEKGKA
jgi:hypothetical protein